MKYQNYSAFIFIFFIIFLPLTGCTKIPTVSSKCTVMFEDNSSLFFPKQIYEINRSSNLSITIGIPHGERISSVNYDNYTVSSKISESLSFDYYTLTLYQIRYSLVLRLDTAPMYTTSYHYGKEHKTSVLITEETPHLYFNTLAYQEEFHQNGFTAIGWNTSAGGNGSHVGFGSRIDRTAQQHLDLYVEYLPWSPISDFTYQVQNNEITITGYHGNGDIIIPCHINSLPVTSIASGAFHDLKISRLVFPHTLKTVHEKAFGTLAVEDFYFYDSVETFPESVFVSYSIRTLHINASLPPVYSGSYFDTYSDKTDYLASIKDMPKIALFCGSSARFGYDSSLIEEAFVDYKVVNMGVYAYSNMLPQADILLHFMKKGDILLSSPELDAISEQFCGETAFDKETFCLTESNYDLLTLLDSRKYHDIFTAFEQYNTERRRMTPRSYTDSASYYDEDGKPQTSFTYNRYGDYILHRENNIEQKNFGIKRAYYNTDYIHSKDLQGINAVYDAFAQKGITVYFSYSPRSKNSLSEDSTEESIIELDNFFRSYLHATVISSIDSSLMEPLYFYGTDNHLSSEGARIHTLQIIKDLQTVISKN